MTYAYQSWLDWAVGDLMGRLNPIFKDTKLDLVKSKIAYWEIDAIISIGYNMHHYTIPMDKKPILERGKIHINPYYNDELLNITLLVEYNFIDEVLITDKNILIMQCEKAVKSTAKINEEYLQKGREKTKQNQETFNTIMTVLNAANSEKQQIVEEAISGLVNTGEPKKKAREGVEEILRNNPKVEKPEDIITIYFKNRGGK